MKNAVEMGSGAIMYVSSLIQRNWRIQGSYNKNRYVQNNESTPWGWI
jgi:hypothetical protein